jgi:hypothetical protein
MLVNRYCQVTLGNSESMIDTLEGRRFSTNYSEVAERGLASPINDNRLPLSILLKKIGLWGIIILSIISAFYFT